MEKTEHHSDITRKRTSLQNSRRKLIWEAAVGPTAGLEELQEHLERTEYSAWENTSLTSLGCGVRRSRTGAGHGLGYINHPIMYLNKQKRADD